MIPDTLAVMVQKTGLGYGGLGLLVRVLRVVQHVAADNLLIKQVLVRLVLQFGGVLLRQGGLQVGLGGLQLQLGVARVDDEERLALLHLLTFRHTDLHQLSADLRRDRHIVLTLHPGTEFVRQLNV